MTVLLGRGCECKKSLDCVIIDNAGVGGEDGWVLACL